MSNPVRYNTGLRYNSGVVYDGPAPNPNSNMPTTTSTDTPVVVSITPTAKAAIIAKIGELAALITFGVGLSDDQRRAMLKMGEKTIGWDEKCAGYMASRPDLIPAYVDMAALAQNRQVRADLGDLLKPLSDVWDKINDTSMVIGSQIYKPELAYYNSAQEAAKHGVPGAQSIADDLKSRFAGQGLHANHAAKIAKTGA